MLIFLLSKTFLVNTVYKSTYVYLKLIDINCDDLVMKMILSCYMMSLKIIRLTKYHVVIIQKKSTQIYFYDKSIYYFIIYYFNSVSTGNNQWLLYASLYFNLPLCFLFLETCLFKLRQNYKMYSKEY